MSRTKAVRYSLGLAVIVALVAAVTFYIQGAAEARPAQLGPFPTGTDVYVDASNTTGVEDGTQANPYNTIQEGVNAASSGKTVGVAPGTYAEEVTMKSGVSLIGAKRETTIIDGGDNSGDVVKIISLSNVRVSGFTIRGAISGGGLPGGAGVFVNTPGGNITIDDNILTGNDFGVGVLTPSWAPGGRTWMPT